MLFHQHSQSITTYESATNSEFYKSQGCNAQCNAGIIIHPLTGSAEISYRELQIPVACTLIRQQPRSEHRRIGLMLAHRQMILECFIERSNMSNVPTHSGESGL